MINSIDQLCFIDSETARPLGATVPSVADCGATRYASEAFATMWTYAIGAAPTRIVALDEGFDRRIRWRDMPEDFRAFYQRALDGDAWFVAWNMGFDRAIWNGAQSDFPHLYIDMTLDAMAQAVASGLPGKLGAAAQFLNITGKMPEGANLIRLFEIPGASPQKYPAEWETFKEYGVRDTDVLREVYQMTNPLTEQAWSEYWASERINTRGVALDVQFVEAAARVADLDRGRINSQITNLSGGAVTAVTQAARILAWVVNVFSGRSAVRDILTKKKEILGDNGEVIRPEKLSLERGRLEKLLAYLDNVDTPLTRDEQRAYDVLSLRLYGGSATPQKFGRAAATAYQGRLHGQYVFNGAPQTGRFSSRGVQVHNLTRAALDNEDEIIDLITARG